VGPGEVTIAGVPDVYEPGQTYTLAVTVSQTNRRRFGFQLTALDGANAKIGALAPIDSSTQLLGQTGPGGRQYVEHTQFGSLTSVVGSLTWQVKWAAPPTDMGTARFFVAGNAANNDGTNQNDYIYTNSASAESPTSNVALELHTDPGGQVLAAGTKYTIDWSATNTSNVDSYELRYSTDDGATFPITNLIFATTDASLTSCEWTVPNKPTTEARIRVTAATKAGLGVPPVVSGRFTIEGDASTPTLPTITSAVVKGKKLFVNGENFEVGAKVELNGEDQKTVNLEDFSHSVKCKKAGKKIPPGATVMLRVRNPDGTASEDFEFKRPS
jgi:hypothetical protein